jgi:1-acyl-sn-glycerol-3-phosphate acyltransferase
MKRNKNKKVKPNRIRSALNSVKALGFLASTLFVMLPLQAYVIGPLFKNHTTVPKLFYKGLNKLFGYKVEFNKASAPIEKKKQSWYVANHMSPVDPFVLGKVIKGHFVAAGWLTQIGMVNTIGKAGRVMFVSQKKDEKFKRRDRGKIVKTFNDGENVAMFPEGWTNDGATVELFRAGLAELLYDGKATDKNDRPVELNNKDIVVQPIAIKVKSVRGYDASDDDALREVYSMNSNKNALKRIWNRLGYRDIVLELTAFPPLKPKDFKDAKSLMNEAHSQIVSVVAPNQKTIEKAPIRATEGEKKTSRPLDQKDKPHSPDNKPQ